MTNAAATADSMTVRSAAAPTALKDFTRHATGAWTGNGKEGERTMWDYEEAMYYSRLLKEGYRDDEIVMNGMYTEDGLDTDLDDWESDDYLWD